MKPHRGRFYTLFGPGQAVGAALLGVFITILAVLNAVSPGLSQDRPKEAVTVTAVEVPVRVFDHNGFIAGLTRDDFEIFENGVKQEITGFEAVSRAISPVPVAMPEGVPQAPRKRNFLLIFNVFDYNVQVGDAIDYFFRNVFRPDDKLVVVIEDRIISITTSEGTETAIAELKKTLKALKRISRVEIFKAYMDLEAKAKAAVLSLGGEDGQELEGLESQDQTPLFAFFEFYKHTWESYRRRVLDVDMDLYRGILRRFKQWDGDKWAICFQQRDLFPRIKSQGRLERALNRYVGSESGISFAARNAEVRWNEIEKSFDVKTTFPADRLQSLFIDANITFHVLIMKSLYQGEIMSRDFDLRDVQADYEDVLRRISAATGGLTVFNNKVAETLKQAAGKEDQYYMLVYQSKAGAAPEDPKIDVKVRKPGVDIVSLKRHVGQKPPAISIKEFKTEGKKIGFDVGNCERIEQGGKNVGRAAVKITLYDENSVKAFSEMKSFDLVADSLHLSLSFDKLASGNYFVIIEAVDLVTGEKDVYSRAINW